MARAVAVSTDSAVIARRGKLMGWSLRETGGAATATVDLYDNASAASGTRVGAVNLAISGSSTVWFGPGVQLANGLFYDVGGTGVVAGSVYVDE